ncbi:hypothetical protein CYMTET_17148, partial [Cymbomonas tetramitiformis]
MEMEALKKLRRLCMMSLELPGIAKKYEKGAVGSGASDRAPRLGSGPSAGTIPDDTTVCAANPRQGEGNFVGAESEMAAGEEVGSFYGVVPIGVLGSIDCKALPHRALLCVGKETRMRNEGKVEQDSLVRHRMVGQTAGDELEERTQDLEVSSTGKDPHRRFLAGLGREILVNPPGASLDEVAQKLWQEGAAATVVAPYWAGQSWFREVEALATEVVIMPRPRDVFTPSTPGPPSTQIEVCWEDDAAYYPDAVQHYTEEGKAFLMSDAGEEETLKLTDETFRLLGGGRLLMEPGVNLSNVAGNGITEPATNVFNLTGKRVTERDTEATALLYSASLCNKGGIKADSLRLHLSGIKNYHEVRGFLEPAKGRAVTRAVKGTASIQAEQGEAPGHPAERCAAAEGAAGALGVATGLGAGELGNHDEAVPLLERGLKMTQKAHGKISPQTVTWLMQLTRAHAQMEVCKIEGANYTKAVQYARRAVDICEGGSSKGARLRLAATLNNLGGLHELMANYMQAAEPRLRCIKVLEPAIYMMRRAVQFVWEEDAAIRIQAGLKGHMARVELERCKPKKPKEKTQQPTTVHGTLLDNPASSPATSALLVIRWVAIAAARRAQLRGAHAAAMGDESGVRVHTHTSLHSRLDQVCALTQARTRGWVSRRRVVKLRQRAERRKQFAQQKDELVYELRDERPPPPQFEDPRESELEAMARQMEEEERKLAEAEAAEAARQAKKDAQRRLRHRPSARAQQARGVALALCRLAATHYCAEEFEQVCLSGV